MDTRQRCPASIGNGGAILPDDAEAHSNLGNALRARGQLEAAVKNHRRALEIRSDYAEAHNKLGNALIEFGQPEEAGASYTRALEIKPDFAEALSNLSVVLKLQNRAAEAEARCRKALEINPALIGANLLLAELHAEDGRFVEAEDLLKRAISIDPDMPEAWTGLVRWRKMTREDTTWLAEAQRIVGRRLPPRREAHLRYALGKYFDDVKDFEQAFTNYRRANELTKQYCVKYDRQELTRYVDFITEFYDQEWLSQGKINAIESKRPIFVIGMWRSGSTLTEQILASHPAIFGAGELTFWKTASGVYERSVFNGERTASTISKLGSDYLNLLGNLSPHACRVLDKMSANFLHLGLVHAALPNARIIHLRRNPIDTCLSIYFQDFVTTHPYANDLEDLAHYYRGYVRVMRHWKSTLPERVILDVPYEKLVAEQEAWSRTMVDFIGLPWNPRCLDFHKTNRAVTTASKWQVRQAINKSSVERWRNYETFIAPLLSLREL